MRSASSPLTFAGGDTARYSDSGRFEIEYLWLIEVDEQGLITALITFGLDAEPAARDEARRRAGATPSAARV